MRANLNTQKEVYFKKMRKVHHTLSMRCISFLEALTPVFLHAYL